MTGDSVEATNLGPSDLSYSDDDNEGKLYKVIHADSVVHKLIWSEKYMQDPSKSVKKTDKYIFQNKEMLILGGRLVPPRDGLAQTKESLFTPLDGLMILAENKSIEEC